MTREMDEFWRPIADPNPEVLARQLAVLRDWLSRPSWTLNQTACLLAGVCPMDDTLSGQAFAAYLPVSQVEAYLPGRQEWEHAPEIGKKITEGRIAQIEASLVQAFSPDRVTPSDLILLGMKMGFHAPWFDYVRENAECRRLLPSVFGDSDAIERPIQVASRKKARKRWDEDDKRKLLNNAGRTEFENLRKTDFSGYRWNSGKLKKTEMAREILRAIEKIAPDEHDCLPSEKTVLRRISEWLG